ncbi:MAG: DUF1475 domain-containing protein [Deltaproteobacteria bacterium]|nr:MAG: DUF1475 domain-containing protein [Deltaproteobacteria bacterium]
MKTVLALLCAAVAALMLWLAVDAALQQDVIAAGRRLWTDPWYRVLLADAYAGFLFFWLWVAWRERSAGRGCLWLLLIMTLGNLAAAAYLLLQLRDWQPADGIARLLLGNRRSVPPAGTPRQRFDGGAPG